MKKEGGEIEKRERSSSSNISHIRIRWKAKSRVKGKGTFSKRVAWLASSFEAPTGAHFRR